MPAVERSLAITDAYRLRLARIVEQAQVTAEARWPTIQEFDATPWASEMAARVALAQAEAIRATRAYLTAYTASETGTRATTTPRVNTPTGFAADGTPLSERMRSPLRRVGWALRDGRAPEDALNLGLVWARTLVEIEIMAAARRALHDEMIAHPQIVGWRRAVRGTCGACIGDTTYDAYSPRAPEVDMNVHPNCMCVAEPVMTGQRELFPRPSAQQRWDGMNANEQDQAIGTEVAIAVRKGIVKLQDLTSPSMNQKALRELLTPTERAKLRKAVVQRNAGKKAAIKKAENKAAREQRPFAADRARLAADRAARAERAAREARAYHLRIEAEAHAERLRVEAAARVERVRIEQERLRAEVERLRIEAENQARSQEFRAAEQRQLAKAQRALDRMTGTVKIKQANAGYKAAATRRLKAYEKAKAEAQAARDAAAAPDPLLPGGDLLTTSRIDNLEPLGGGVNDSYTGVLSDGTKVVVKPRSDKWMRDGLAEDHGIEHSIAASRIADELDVITPRVVKRANADLVDSPFSDIPLLPGETGGAVSVQPWTDGLEEMARATASQTDAENTTMFDWLIANTDRHTGNMGILRDGSSANDGRYVAIDHDLAFPYEASSGWGNATDWVDANYTSIYGTDVPARLMEKLRGMMRHRVEWTDRLREDGLTTAEIDHMFNRIDRVLQTGKFRNPNDIGGYLSDVREWTGTRTPTP